ncbi:2-hydroxyacid dehydrogenase [Bordetella petrii]|uniref:2-hydroxyacid dehydrogenase n=1 Tax=Bordetella petrii TaxID=94624 RepID=UPI003731A39E
MSAAARHRLLQLGPLPPDLQRRAAEQYVLEPLWTQPAPADFLAAQHGAFDGAIMMSRHGCQAPVIACLGAAPRPGVVACFGVGYDSIDLAAARRHGVQVSTTPDVLTDCVADTALGLMLACARRLVAADRHVQSGAWLQGPFPLATRVSGKRVGIVGLGRIGQAIARRAQGFDMPVRYHARSARPGVAYPFVAELAELADWADFLVLACPGGPQTRHLVSAAALEALGPDGYLINIARGSVVDEDALVAAIRAGRIAGAGLDVYADEPRVPAGLLGNDRVVTLPHIAASTRETRRAMEQLVLDNLAAFFATGKVLTPPC